MDVLSVRHRWNRNFFCFANLTFRHLIFTTVHQQISVFFYLFEDSSKAH